MDRFPGIFRRRPRTIGWGLQSDLAANRSGGLTRLADRLFDGVSSQYVLHFLIVRASAARVLIRLLAIAVMCAAYQRLNSIAELSLRRRRQRWMCAGYTSFA